MEKRTEEILKRQAQKEKRKEYLKQYMEKNRDAYNEYQKNYQREYNRANAKNIKKLQVAFNKYEDRDILEYLDTVDNKSNFIKELIRKHLED